MEGITNVCQQQPEEVVLIVGAGPSGLAVAACLAEQAVPSLILERDDCIGSLWRKRSYDRVCLHLAKQFCSLPHMPHSDTTPTYIPKSEFISYLDSYAERFRLRIRFGRRVESARYDQKSGRWIVKARNGDVLEEYIGRFLVVAAGENDQKVVPDVNGLDSFKGVVIHSSEYRTALAFKGKDVLVVGSDNSGMDIAYDLFEAGARCSIVVRSMIHIVTKEIWLFAMRLMKYLMKYLRRPNIGPMYMKCYTPVYQVIDVGTYDRIKTGEIQVLPSLTSIEGSMVTFSNGKTHHYDAIIFATGYRNTIRQWLETDEGLIGKDGMAKNNYPDNWKGQNGLYCAGLNRRGLFGSSEDGLAIADDISKAYNLPAHANMVSNLMLI
ncbi:Flavin-containing monooxygenase [Rhynchospora pubera]|uniref:indole-3-pyruvate monooxygenase n=1 Tax=Rhynchospora pubera TaxID=906938 RepID=A0AAV8FDD0_9POAL|nr:Flavin-containing monooxygenase [Rhynchospora pubera]KAJ4809194.1 Flavin-containing monooxygenase [Rhynchospora pubera]